MATNTSSSSIGQVNWIDLFPEGDRTVESYEKIEKVGKGAYGKVYKARDRETGEIVALKKFLQDNNAPHKFPATAAREYIILRKLEHENVIKMKETMKSSTGRIYIVYEYMEHDLAGLINQPSWFHTLSTPEIKCLMKQLLTGLRYCHENKVLHRDIKAGNILLNNEGILKLADFGLSRSIARIRSDQKLTSQVITFWYRPPELLLGETQYGTAIDIWSAGCIFAELYIGKSIFRGKTEVDTLNRIFDLCGTPDHTNWPEVADLPLYTKLKPSRRMPRRLREVFQHIGKHALDLLERMLTLDPNQRISAEEALDADYFRTDPLPWDPKSLPKFEPSHIYEVEKKLKRLQNEPRTQPSSPPPPPPLPRPHGGSGYRDGAPNFVLCGPPLVFRHMPSFGAYGAPYYAQWYELAPGYSVMPSSSFHGAGGIGSAYGDGIGSYPGIINIPRFVYYGARGSGSGYEGASPHYILVSGPFHGFRYMPSVGSYGVGGSGSGYGGEAPNGPPRLAPSNGSRDVSISGSHGGGRGAPSQPQGSSMTRKQNDSQKS